MVRLLRILACALAVVALVPAMAHASNVREYQLQYSPVVDGTQSLLIVTAIVDPAASLPTSVTVPVPAGATLMWSGEVLGGAPAAAAFRAAGDKPGQFRSLPRGVHGKIQERRALSICCVSI
jgi:hypothetical protein